MNGHLDIFGIGRTTLPVHSNWPFDAVVEGAEKAERNGLSPSFDNPKNTAVSTLALASQSYLVPWLRAIQLSQGLGIPAINSSWLFHEPVDFFVGFGAFSGLSFANWWMQWGFVQYGWAITDVQVRYPKRRCKDWAAKTRLVGNQLRLAPQAIVKSTDLPKERAEKRKVMSQVTSQYFAKGQAIVKNAALGLFPSTCPIKKGMGLQSDFD